LENAEATPATEVAVDAGADAGSVDTGTAPAEPSAAESSAPVADASAPTPVDSSSVEGNVQDSSPSHSQSSFPSAEDFDWNAWDMNPENLPELLHPWMKGALTPYVNEYQRTKDLLQAQENKYNQLRQMYDAVLVGGEDPRIKDFATKEQEFQQQLEQLNQRLADGDQRYEKYIEEESRQWAEAFADRYGEVLENEETMSSFNAFWDYTGDPEVSIAIAQLPSEARIVAAQALKENSPPRIALQLARAKVSEVKGSPPEPRSSAFFTNGADGAGHTPETADKSPFEDVDNFADYRSAVAAKAFAKFSR
jgi:hypothetical protein